ncbi:hypothetical protein GCM10010502_17790 [Kitasatospora aureofaciens]|uniref:Uncharacterized protein n=1 Tax=Kitasatospora aureofaciens TaxID=1894 RepID=A0A8H9HI76_KITAU|nr:hypothetical protein GCM10010502_17790 [Kitasatospora aureofaciens]
MPRRSLASDEVENMTQQPGSKARAPQFELRWGGLHLTIQRIPAWLITAATAGAGTLAALLTRR